MNTTNNEIRTTNKKITTDELINRYTNVGFSSTTNESLTIDTLDLNTTSRDSSVF